MEEEMLRLQAKECGEMALSDDEATRLQLLASTRTGLIIQQECYWRQRARMKWLACGDANTKLVHLSGNKIGFILCGMMMIRRCRARSFFSICAGGIR